MMARQAVVDEVRSWVGTPFQHQGRLKGIGCDCAGLVGGVAVALGLLPRDWWQAGFGFAGYSRQPDGRTFLAACRDYMAEIGIDDALPGDALAMRFRRDPQHIAIVVPYRLGGLAIVHALTAGVVEHRLDDRWRQRVVHAFRLPGVA